MSTKDDGGPAFPAHEQWNEWSDLKAQYMPRTGPRGGMSLRDYFAAQALAALIAKSPLVCEDKRDDAIVHAIASNVVGAYAYADALLAERNKP